MRVSPHIFAVAVLTIFLGTIYGFQVVGIWSVTGKLTSSGEAVEPSLDDVNTIKGWMTLEQISTTYKVNLEEVLTHFSLPTGTLPSTPLKDLESDEFSVTNLRDWLEIRLEPSPTATSTPDTLIPTLSSTLTTSLSLATPLPADHIALEFTITGKTTFQELFDWGVNPDVIEQILGSALPNPETVIKDYVTQKGMQFSSVKTALQKEVDNIK